MRETMSARDTHFGFRQVPLDDKQRLVDDVFHKVARRYDLMNDLMSGGLHRAWKDALVTAINPPTKGRSGRLEEKPSRDFALLDVALAEMHRVLRIGGHFLCLEFSNVDVPGLDALYELYSFNLVPALGRMVVGDAEPYRYLVESIRRFPRPNAFAEMMRAAGFRRVSHRLMSGGIVALHSGWRL